MSKSNGHAKNGKAKKPKSRIETIGEPPPEETPVEQSAADPGAELPTSPNIEQPAGEAAAPAPQPPMTEWEQAEVEQEPAAV